MKTSEALEKAWALIDSPKKWTQNAFARDKSGRELYVTLSGQLQDDRVGAGHACFCAKGAVRYACKDHVLAIEAEKALAEAVKAVEGDRVHEGVMVFNDSHTHQELKEVWHIAIAKAKEQETP